MSGFDGAAQAAIQVGGAIGTSLIQGNMNKRADNRAWGNWVNMQKWNSPANQRRRMEEAGFNPNLTFGSSMGAVTGSPPPTRANQAPDIGGALARAFDQTMQNRNMELKNENLELQKQIFELNKSKAQKQFEVSDQQIEQMGANTSLLQHKAQAEMLKNRKSIYDFGFKENEDTPTDSYRRALSGQRDAIDLRNSGTSLDNSRKLIENSNLDPYLKGRINLINSNLQTAVKQRDLIGVSTEIKRIEQRLREHGLSPNSPEYVKILAATAGYVPAQIAAGLDSGAQAILDKIPAKKALTKIIETYDENSGNTRHTIIRNK